MTKQEVFDHFLPILGGWANNVAHSSGLDQEDLEQAAREGLVLAVNDYDEHEVANEEGWFRWRIHNHLIHYLRKNGRYKHVWRGGKRVVTPRPTQVSFEDLPAELPAEESRGSFEQREMLRHAIEQCDLTERERETIFFLYVADLSVAQAAENMGISTRRVETYRSRTLSKIREELVAA